MDNAKPQASPPQQSIMSSNDSQRPNVLLRVVGAVVLLGLGLLGGYLLRGNNRIVSQNVNQQITPSPTSVIQNNKYNAPITKPDTVSANNFTYKNFSLSYPKDWVLLDVSTTDNFPLKQRLSSLYASDKVIALSKQGTDLIIVIEKASEGGMGGIFVGDVDYNEFVSTKDKVNISNSVFYLNRDHEKSSSLLESHAGPYGWSVLAEYIPNKRTESGNIFRGYENIIKRNGYAYNFIVTSNEGGNTNPQLQEEIIGMLETINW